MTNLTNSIPSKMLFSERLGVRRQVRIPHHDHVFQRAQLFATEAPGLRIQAAAELKIERCLE
jgi:hypothetical protein